MTRRGPTTAIVMKKKKSLKRMNKRSIRQLVKEKRKVDPQADNTYRNVSLANLLSYNFL